jgi:hypothetical protein
MQSCARPISAAIARGPSSEKLCGVDSCDFRSRVPLRVNFAREFAMPLEPLADAEERRAGAAPQDRQHAGSDLRVRAVVDRDRDAAARRSRGRQTRPDSGPAAALRPQAGGRQREVIGDQ